jgi:hypothetical protein
MKVKFTDQRRVITISGRIGMKRQFHVRLLEFTSSILSILILLAQDKEDNGSLEMEVEALRNRCDRYEKMIKDLESKCEIQQMHLEMLRQDVIGILSAQNRLDTTYKGKSYELIQ